MIIIRAFGVTFAIVAFALAFAFTGSAAIVYVLEHAR